MDKKHNLTTAILDAFEDGIYVMDCNLVVEYMNSAMVAEFGDGVGKKCHQVVNQSEDRCPWCLSDEVFAGKTVRREVYVPLVDKTYYLTEIPFENKDGTLSKLSIYHDISKRKIQEEMLRASEEEFRNLFEHVASGVFISSKKGKFLNANQALLDMLGYDSKEEFLNIDLPQDLYVRSEDRRTFQEMMERDGRVIDYEVEFKRKDGSTIPILLTGHARYDQHGDIIGYEGLNVDLTQRKLMEKELREAYDFMNKIVQSSPNAITATDMKGNILIWNQGAEETLGYRASDVIGKMNIRKIYPEGEARKVMQMLRNDKSGEIGRLNSYPMVYVRRDGEVVEGNLSAAIIYDADGNEIASVGSFVDLRDRLQMERALRDTQEQLLQSEKLAAMGRLTSQIAHELNNPLYGIMNTLELLKTEIPADNKRRKILEMALSETVRLSDLLRKMLSFSKPDQEERHPVDINSVLDEILLLHEKQLRENDIRLVATFAEGLGLVNASKNQLRQVFLNMVANARDAMPDGGTLSVVTGGGPDTVYVEVSDTGTGIRTEHLDKIFESFFTTKGEVKGVGLGLSVCYGFIKDHGGDIEVKSQVGEGTTFTISLPMHIAPEDSKENIE
ncbi:MAG: PAS domain S-box protein [Desulfobacteraceae bacterium]|jgi:two-component system NtrC family sensor kinase|nr:PAS domain S-box protein [Desulfobacteraceae bacterium]